MLSNIATGWMILSILICNLVLTNTYPQYDNVFAPSQSQEQHNYYTNPQLNRKFAEKPNSIKKVALDDIDDIQTNQIQDGGFSWSNMLGVLMQMMFNGGNTAPTKSDDIDNSGSFSQSPWANVISVGLKIITAILGGGGASDGIDKVDNGNSPMQNVLAAVFTAMFGAKDPDQVNTMAKQAGEFLNIVVTLLDALKTSFSHRSLAARNLGKKDSFSDAAIASIIVLKTYARSYRQPEDKCLQKHICDANNDCMNAIGGSSIFCQLGNYATSYVIERQFSKSFEALYEAGRNGRMGLNCRQLYLDCNEI
ncbi:uncharacterized protein LOC129765231 isoform X1 [Toxorhynchites rutilus septentrionalis]|uniref:uncharacterized protein LOC129765231 isoform X1 n=1 Tax=Toxorhynchites rutilus septentrionalis TaxID=329112 RepID=UPI00247870A5|nr:uncharacterized protein LOC129765231 isoform X1 [Toxorhynchites rutilus septentrionalis]XP_055621281.1 uncharacterized protein LOC129765231 isoform X1 [Toxorhynchites rutilus septentrionalis]